MKPTLTFITKTTKGGIFFLIPIALIVIICDKVIQFIKPAGLKISSTIDPAGNSFFNRPYLICALLLMLLCFGLGLIATSKIGDWFVTWLEQNILSVLPGYLFLKSTGQALVGIEDATTYPVVLAQTDGWVIAFLINRIDDKVILFIPGSPNPSSGSVMIFNNAEIIETTLTQKEAIRYLRNTGIGFKDLKIKEGNKVKI
jgi:uncharacterized membrane protein